MDDPVQEPVGGPGRGASPINLIGFTIGDKIKQKWPNSRVVGVSFKDRSAVLMAGHRGNGAFWFENVCGCFITSTYYASKVPDWLVKFNSLKLADKYGSIPWTRLINDEAVYEKYAGKDDAPGEWDLKDTTFPHQHRGQPGQSQYYENIRRTPFADEILLRATLEILQAYDLGTDSSPDVLAVGFSATDVIGHIYGAYSQEQMDELLRLDVVLDKLFKAVEARVGISNLLVVLTADHASTPLVEWLQKNGSPEARRYNPGVLETAVRDALKKRSSGSRTCDCL